MKTVTSISGGRTSAYLAANYPTDYNVFSLVRIEDQRCRFPDEKIRLLVEDRIQAPFIATAEYDEIIYTILDLEQYFGREIKWVTGITFDEVLRRKPKYLPNITKRYCTSWMKIEPIFNWWRKNFNEPIQMNIGYRANEKSRVQEMSGKVDKDGLLRFKTIVGQFETKRGPRNRWANVPWQNPNFPLYTDQIFSDTIQGYWIDKPVRFAPYNNCVGCFHREEIFLRFMFQQQTLKMRWFKEQEVKNKRWKSGMKYDRIERLLPQTTFFDSDFSPCDAGVCGM